MDWLKELCQYFNISPDCPEAKMYIACKNLLEHYHRDRQNGSAEKSRGSRPS